MKTLIRSYKFLISPLLGCNCRFHPSCSDYALQALEAHGTVKGGLLSFWRILRCNPWHSAPVNDPVPPAH